MACDNNDLCPPHNYGRLQWIADQLGSRYGVSLSKESVRRWASGEGSPRPDKGKLLAELLKVDESWLLLGVQPEGDRKTVGATQNAAVNLLSGILLARDITVALPDEDDPLKDCVNLYAVIGGRQLRLHATFGQPSAGGAKFLIPVQFENVTVIGVVPTGDDGTFNLYHLLPSAISKYGNKRGGYIEMSGEVSEYSVAVKDVKCPRIRSVKAML
ncbi:MAG TPA: hypothetical protein ENH55_12285 [Aurantimonas coralicida]|nr:hypothetical protein [Aurantimonas coralicida]HEU02588.1 hypothetical protein [Aurantimonas coralicida]